MKNVFLSLAFLLTAQFCNAQCLTHFGNEADTVASMFYYLNDTPCTNSRFHVFDENADKFLKEKIQQALDTIKVPQDISGRIYLRGVVNCNGSVGSWHVSESLYCSSKERVMQLFHSIAVALKGLYIDAYLSNGKPVDCERTVVLTAQDGGKVIVRGIN